GEVYSTFDGISTYRVARFKEKPNRELAQQYYLDRSHLWNSGMFIWSTKAILSTIERCKPEMFAQLQAYTKSIDTPAEPEALCEFFDEVEHISVDVALLEQADNVIVMRAKMIWDDIGSWRALERINPSDHRNNVSIGRVLSHDCFEVTAVNSGEGLIATLGVSDLIVVKTGKVVLVANKTKVDDLKALLERVRADEDLSEYL
ncbi:MAG: sugar phosphate nucleotidyltransferase, partial [bacterium]